MGSRRFFIGAAAIAAMALSAGNAFFSGGSVVSAELSSRSVELKGFRAAAYPGMSAPSAFAAVTVAVPAKMSVAVQDYSLSYGGGDYPCVAVRKGDGAWDCSLDARKPSSDGERWTFLFALNGTLFSGSDDMKMDLRSNFTDEKLELKFRNLKGAEFSSAKKAPDSGAL